MTARLSVLLACVALLASACGTARGGFPIWRDEFSRQELLGWAMSSERADADAWVGRTRVFVGALQQQVEQITDILAACPRPAARPSSGQLAALEASLRSTLLTAGPATAGALEPAAPTQTERARADRALLEALESLRAADQLLASAQERGDPAPCPAARAAADQAGSALQTATISTEQVARAAGLPSIASGTGQRG